jgi:hypothetical protein
MHTNNKLEALKGSDHLKYIGLGERVILKRILVEGGVC